MILSFDFYKIVIGTLFSIYITQIVFFIKKILELKFEINDIKTIISYHFKNDIFIKRNSNKFIYNNNFFYINNSKMRNKNYGKIFYLIIPNIQQIKTKD